MQISPLAPENTAKLPPLPGVRLATVEAGIKYRGRPDLMVMVFDRPAQIAGVFTRSKCASAPVDWCKRNIGNGSARAIVVNSGNANAFTGMRGANASLQTAEAAALAVDCSPGEIFLASTGVIGEPLDAAAFTPLLDKLARNAQEDNWRDAAEAIRTTDTFAKLAAATAKIGDMSVRINGIAKGSGMIAPDMATMLSFIVTDAPIAAPVLQSLLRSAVDDSFNCITVDSDTSTSDTVLLAATGTAASDATWISDPDDPLLDGFRQALNELMQKLALLIIRDGEGASKLVEVEVIGAVDNQSAKRIAFSIANSPLVKTAMAGEDANWGRVVMAVGKAGEPADRDRLSIWFGGIRVALNGERDPDYSEDEVSATMKNPEIYLRVDLGLGSGIAKVWTCDLTKAYIAINGDYRS